jgi:quinol monooxygenase YgiN
MSAAKTPLIYMVFAGIGIGAVLYLSPFLFNQRTPSSRTTTAVHKKAFDLIVALTFKSTRDKTTFVSMFSSLAEYIRLNEPTTLSYELAESDKDPLRVVIIERYVDKVKIHNSMHKCSVSIYIYNLIIV